MIQSVRLKPQVFHYRYITASGSRQQWKFQCSMFQFDNLRMSSFRFSSDFTHSLADLVYSHVASAVAPCAAMGLSGKPAEASRSQKEAGQR